MDNWQSQREARGKTKHRKYLQGVFNVAILLAVFWVGLGVGQGKIVWGPDAIFRESVQQTDDKQLDYKGVEQLYNALNQSFDGQLDKSKLETGLKEGLVQAAGDPYTEYLTEKENQEFDEQLNGSFEGIGAELGKEDQSVVIISPIAGFPAKQAGLRPGDAIAEIDGESAFDISITEAVNKIRGPKGTDVTLAIIRDGDSMNVTITRDTITIPSVETEYKGDVGIMTISRFGDDTVDLAAKAANEFNEKRVKSVILDLRGNPGGRLDAAVDISELWLKSGQTILEEKRGGEQIKTFTSEGDGLLLGKPLVVLLDGGSASASEIVAGALHDNDKATLIGTQSYGKGSVQELRDLPLGGVLKVTVAHWYTPGGRNIDKEGIAPDMKVKLSDKDIENKNDKQLQAAVDFLKNR